MLKLRPYQSATHEALKYHYEKGSNRLLVNLATGLGKTSAIAAVLPETFPDLAEHGLLFLSHRREILYQAHRTFKEKYGTDRWIGMEMGEYHCTGQEDIVFASVDSIGRMMGRRINKFKNRYFGIVVPDEGHHVIKEGTWDNILNFFGIGSDLSQAHVFPGGIKPLSVFLTATPTRADGQALAPFLDEIAMEFTIKDGIKEGWLTDIKAYHAELTNGEYDEFEHDEQIDFLIKVWNKYADGMRTLSFARSVAQSEMLAATLNRDNYCSAGHVDATTPDEFRQDTIARFCLPHGDPDAIHLMTNRMIFTEGYDNPMIQCILDNAPTQSQSLYIQKIGRGLRVDPSIDLGSYETASERKEAIRRSAKPFLTYITTFALKHGLDMPATLFGLPKNLETNDRLLSEVIDVIQFEEEVMPEAPTRDLSMMESLDISLKRQDIWTQTIYSEELRALTPLRWIVGENFAALRLPHNPFSVSIMEQTPMIVAFAKTDRGWQLNRILEGGWIEKIRRPTRAVHEPFNHFTVDLNTVIKKMDRWLKQKEPEMYGMLQRDHNGPATEKMIQYLKRKKLTANWDNLTMETAMILKDFSIVQPKLAQFGLPTD